MFSIFQAQTSIIIILIQYVSANNNYNITAIPTSQLIRESNDKSLVINVMSSYALWYIIGGLILSICFCLLLFIVFIHRSSKNTEKLENEFAAKMKELQGIKESINKTPISVSKSPSDGTLISIKKSESPNQSNNSSPITWVVVAKNDANTKSCIAEINGLTDNMTWNQQMLKLQAMHHSLYGKTIPIFPTGTTTNAIKILPLALSNKQKTKSTTEISQLSELKKQKSSTEISVISQLSQVTVNAY